MAAIELLALLRQALTDNLLHKRKRPCVSAFDGTIA